MRERLIGALVLVAIVVLLVPAVLKGRDRKTDEPPVEPTRSVEVRIDAEESPGQDEVLVPETLAIDEPGPPSPVAKRPAPDTEAPPAAPVRPEERSAVATVPVRAGAETPAWAVQLGAFGTRDKANKLVADLRRRGYAAFVLEYRASGQLLHRVRVGPEQDRERAAAIAERLRKDGFEPVVARHP